MSKKIQLLLVGILVIVLCCSSLAFGKEQKTINIITCWEFPNEVLQAFEKSTGIAVKQDVIPGADTYVNTRNARMASGDDVDIVALHNASQDLRNFSKNKYVIDLSKEKWLKNFYPSMAEWMRINAETTDSKFLPGVCYESLALAIWYNKSMFKQYKLAPPKNWDDFLAACDTLKKNGVAPLVQGAKTGWPLDQELGMTRNRLCVEHPNIYADLRSGKIKWTDPSIKSIYNRLVFKLLTKPDYYYVSGLLGTTYEQCWQLFLQKKAAMWVMGSWATEVMTKTEAKPDFELGVMPYPVYNEKGIAQHAQVSPAERPFGILASSKKIPEAKKFLEFLTGKKIATLFASKNMAISTVKGVTSNTLPAAKDWAAVMKLPLVKPPFFGDPEVRKIEYNLLQNVVAGQMTIDQYLNELQRAQEKDNEALK